MQPLIDCLEDIKCWMSNNFLQLNNDKTEVILFGPSKTRNSVAGNLENLTPYIKSHVKNLGVIFDSELCLEKQISSVVKNSYYQLRIISRLKSSLSFQDLEIVIHAFITSRLDYGNSLCWSSTIFIVTAADGSERGGQTVKQHQKTWSYFASFSVSSLASCLF